MPKHANEDEKPGFWHLDLSHSTAEQKHANPFVTLFVVIPICAAILTGVAMVYAKIKGIY